MPTSYNKSLPRTTWKINGLSVIHFSLWTRKSNGTAVSPEAEGTLVRVRSEEEMAAPCTIPSGLRDCVDGQIKGRLTSAASPMLP